MITQSKIVIPAWIAGQIGTIADLHLPEGQCTRIYIVNPGSMDGFELTIPYDYAQDRPWHWIPASRRV